MCNRPASTWRPAVAAGVAIVAGGTAEAQMMPPDDSLVKFSKYTAVRERNIPGYQAQGLPLGSFRLYPSLTVTPQYNDNIFVLDTPKTDDVSVRVAPGASIQSNWSSSSLSLNASGQFDRFADNKSENADGADISLYGTHDLGASTRVRAYAHYLSGRESRESQNVFALTDRPIAFDTQTYALGVSQRFSFMRISAEAELTRSDFSDGVLRSTGAVFDQDYRDRELKRIRVRAEVLQSPSLAYFAQATFDKTDYDQPTALGVSRNSNVMEILGGIRAELPILMRGEIGVGYYRSRFQGATFRNFSGFAINGKIQYFPTQLTTVTLTAQRAVNDDGLPNSSGYLATTAGLQVDHELLRQLVLGANLGYERDTFNGIDRRDRRVSYGASADYKMNRRMSWRLSYDRLRLRSDGVDQYKSFSRNRVLLGLSLRI